MAIWLYGSIAEVLLRVQDLLSFATLYLDVWQGSEYASI